MPEPVAPPIECVSWKPCRQSYDSASLNDVKHGVDQLSALGVRVVALGPVVSRIHRQTGKRPSAVTPRVPW